MPTEQTNIEPGQILEGRVQGITTFGAFIELPGGEVGLVHISEIADTYVKDIKDFIREGDTVGVKVLSVAGKKIGLSIKQAAPPKEEKPKPAPNQRSHTGNFQRNNPGGKTTTSTPVTLDDKIARFLKESDERMQPLKNRQEPKRRRNS
ncbi:MAG TPA: S1 RNA-binding domain-containing protein [Syntrophomonadaceae bacterium]|jgi:S1 RNA binding domain protein|nr:S1 RNA-binding domain-containing protein [Syntrophomonadaceae bacterium]HRX20225.1 S1 RNA-binding domain-containing protein [Syntrophomonadaceae bacterium]